MGIRNLITKGAQRAGDAIARVSSLNPSQLDEIEQRREAYLSQKPDPSDQAAIELTHRLLGACGIEIHNAFLNQVDTVYAPVDPSAEYEGKSFDATHNIRSFEVTKWVVDPEEQTLDKLVNVYEVLSNSHCNIALIFNRTKTSVHVYFAIVDTNNSKDNVDANSYCKRLRSALKGNFPGSTFSKKDTFGRPSCIEDNRDFSVASISNIPTEKSEKFVSQTIEKLLDGFAPHNAREEYTIVLLASPAQDIQARMLHLAELYSALAPYKEWQTNFTFTESSATSSTATFGINAGVSAGVQNGTNASEATNEGQTQSDGTSNTHTDGRSSTYSRGHNQSTTGGISLTESANVSAGAQVGLPGTGVNASVSAGLSATESLSTTRGSSTTQSLGNSVSDAVTKNIGRAISKGLAKTKGITNALNLGANFGANFSRSSTITATIGKNEGITQTFTNYTIQHTLELLEAQMKRLNQASALGMWDFAAYILSEDEDVANNVAHTYLSLTQGEESYLSAATVNHWRGDRGDLSRQARTICAYLRDLRHPIFALNPAVLDEQMAFAMYPSIVTATTMLSGKELAYSLNFPKHSVPGLPVVECAEFGRSVSTYDVIPHDNRQIHLGCIFHMHNEERAQVHLSANSLASHTFVTGSTGAGKTNTVCRLLDEALEKNIPFLVIEPAKGEYKDMFGMEEGIYVFGTNQDITPLLRINPFSFPSGIHVLEHLDRLIEVFNACWPMYAAMPAVLKDAVERSYADCGWNLSDSTNAYDCTFFPSFADVARNVKQILDSSEYDAENKGAYKGSLLTRLQSLTNGINGMILTEHEIDAADLFDRNTIVDLSRVGSAETKALLMGLVVLKLQEHRMTQATGTNAPLRHLTVLEEAHNLLRRTSTEQLSEGANLLGKSVEMIANAIAEMRTYGEGFVIADQAPGLLDMSVIRNTNTKIIMRMPDLSDRELVGRAANLNDNQIAELARLPRGVAAVYQNDWIQPVLCKIDQAAEGERYDYAPMATEESTWRVQDALTIADLLVRCNRIAGQTAIQDITAAMERLNLQASTKVAILKTLNDPPRQPAPTTLAPIMSALFPSVHGAVVEACQRTDDTKEWTTAAEAALQTCLKGDIEEYLHDAIVRSVITQYIYFELQQEAKLSEWVAREGLNQHV